MLIERGSNRPLPGLFMLFLLMEPGAMVIRHLCARSDMLIPVPNVTIGSPAALATCDRNDVFRLPLVTRQLLNCRAPAGRAETTRPTAMMLL